MVNQPARGTIPSRSPGVREVCCGQLRALRGSTSWLEQVAAYLGLIHDAISAMLDQGMVVQLCGPRNAARDER